MGMGAGYKEFRRIAAHPAPKPQPKQVPLTQRKGPTALHKSIVGIAKQKVKLDGQETRPARKKGDKVLEPKLVELAKERFQQCEEAYSQIRKEFLDDLKFRAGDQWNDAIAADRAAQGRPCLTLNQIPQFVREVTNEQRQNRPGIKVNPVDGDADVDTADIIQGLIRHIEYDSGADAAYDTGFNYAAIGGFGFWYVTTEYSDAMSFDQDIKIKRIADPLSVYIDPYATEPDRSDMKYAFLNISKYSKKEFKERWPDATASSSDTFWTSQASDDWISKEDIRVVDYYYKEFEKKTICQLSDGSSILKESLKSAFPDVELKIGAPLDIEGLAFTIVNERETDVSVVKWCKLNGSEILEETEWAGKYIPVVPVLGDELVIDGQVTLEGVVRFAKDPQRQYNFMASATTETIGLAPKAPYIVAEGQIAGYEDIWQNANRQNYAVLPYKQVDVAGKPAPVPQRQSFEPAIQATTMAMMQAANDLRSVTGVQSAALGERSNEKSGVAIRERADQSQSSNYHYGDNLTRAIRYTGRILVDLIPHIYDADRTVRIIGQDDVQTTAQIGQPQDPQQNSQLSKVERIYSLGVGKYDVTISTGPSYQTKRQEATESMLELMKAVPIVGQVAPDIVIRKMDFPGNEEVADRVEKSLPPGLVDDPTQGAGDIPPQAQQAIAQLTEQNQKLTQELNATHDDLEKNVSIKHMELESKERIEFAKIAAQERQQDIDLLKIQATLAQSQATADAELSAQMAEREYNAIDSHLDRIHENHQNMLDHEQALEMGAQGHQQGLESQEQAAALQPEPAGAAE
jgi:hypothetical protein